MSFQEIQDLSTDNVIALGGTNKKTGKKNPTSIEGYYLGSRQVDSKKSKNGKAYIHVFQTNAGNVGVWGKTDSDRKILTVKPGTMTRVSHTGFQSTPNGEMYKYSVAVDKDNTIEVADFGDLTTAGGSNDEDFTAGPIDDNFGYGDDEDASDDVDYEQPVATAALTSSAANQKKTLDLLNKSGKAKR